MNEAREQTWDITLGLDRLRWGDSIQEIQELYPVSRQLPGRSGVNPFTGGTYSREPGVIIPHGGFSLPIDFLGIEISLSAHAGKDGISELCLLSGYGDDRYKSVTWHEWSLCLLQHLASLGGLFQYGPVDPDRMEQCWKKPPIEISLFLEHKGYSLTFTHSDLSTAQSGI